MESQLLNNFLIQDIFHGISSRNCRLKHISPISRSHFCSGSELSPRSLLNRYQKKNWANLTINVCQLKWFYIKFCNAPHAQHQLSCNLCIQGVWCLRMSKRREVFQKHHYSKCTNVFTILVIWGFLYYSCSPKQEVK